MAPRAHVVSESCYHYLRQLYPQAFDELQVELQLEHDGGGLESQEMAFAGH